ncbi:MAG TPA: hypothetical protein VMX13_07655 [Sedimentisphaerales bacterium]|nr:hypothetical protein [Sedimentisphaerales bacterium]
MKYVHSISSTIFVPLILIVSLPFMACADEDAQFEQIDRSYYETDVNSLINIGSAADIAARRQALIRYIWGGKGFPAQKLPAEVKQDIKDERYAELFNAGLRQIDRITVNMDYGLESVIYHFIPKTPNNKLIIYHQGHRGDFIQGIDTIRAFIEKGCAVMAISMPLLGMNNQPVVNLDGVGRFHITKHEHLKLLKNPISFFVEPIAVAINYADKFKYDRISMIGISGGGWTTTLYAAIDPRIKNSYPVAGSLPIYLRSDSQRDWGDYEQTLPDLYHTANYLELYVMGSYGTGRHQIQILNKYDSCCFAGIKYRTYEKVVRDIVAGLGEGNFEVSLDDTHKEHKISDEALKVVFVHEGL